MSSHRLKPHFARTSRPRSSPSPAPLPTHMRTKEGSAASAGTGMASRSSHVNDEEKGGSMRMTSNFVGCKVASSAYGRYVGASA